ncbi:putative Ecp7(P20) [Drepanopeziza brunnea f. sp. 'multigermtubi' MB_m1]|uniref:LysM03p n=2 Tax=Drepanopeziza brunnea f. sp. 'multigermtubi' TaxID=698441 RepID=J9XU53_9HELO|nr:putative Ecp7(P20) [Drepanopeziza brunnea f. sp. 'multigermtubi' MB_m1]AFS30721.1 LysM03p [Drepanopeziza brunnea f. sp. 'multigermtubi']EKD12385.1 putative Ecp7(P20) [Drepanopeziza brunnea f. sp. 'multigermtubi' MB_m1]
MRFNNNLLLASFLGVATAIRRSCRPDLTSSVTGTGYYTVQGTDTWANVAADFCSTESELQNMNPTTSSFSPNQIIKVLCKSRKRNCSRIPGKEFGYYTVVEGDELSLIASDFCADYTQMWLLNLTLDQSKKLAPGTILQVPCGWN